MSAGAPRSTSSRSSCSGSGIRRGRRGHHGNQLAETLAAFFLSAYSGISIPVIALGVALQHINTHDALLDFAIVIVVGILAAAPSLLAHRPRPRRPPRDKATRDKAGHFAKR